MRIVSIIFWFVCISIMSILFGSILLLSNTVLGSSECTVLTWDNIKPSTVQIVIHMIGALVVSSSKSEDWVNKWLNKHPKLSIILITILLLVCIPLIFINLC